MAYIVEWFKVIQNGQVIGVITDQSFARYSEKSGRVHICKANEGQYAVLNDRYYHDDWMLGIDPNCYIGYETATVVSIRESEFTILEEQFRKSSEPVPVKTEIKADELDNVLKKLPATEEATVDFMRETKLSELRDICQKEIEKGVSLVLSDGAPHHFSMSQQDQLNLMELELALMTNLGIAPYHADSELTQYFSESDVSQILNATKRWKH